MAGILAGVQRFYKTIIRLSKHMPKTGELGNVVHYFKILMIDKINRVWLSPTSRLHVFQPSPFLAIAVTCTV